MKKLELIRNSTAMPYYKLFSYLKKLRIFMYLIQHFPKFFHRWFFPFHLNSRLIFTYINISESFSLGKENFGKENNSGVERGASPSSKAISAEDTSDSVNLEKNNKNRSHSQVIGLAKDLLASQLINSYNNPYINLSNEQSRGRIVWLLREADDLLASQPRGFEFSHENPVPGVQKTDIITHNTYISGNVSLADNPSDNPQINMEAIQNE